MFSTNHFKARMSQRGISKKVIDLVLAFGKDEGDKLFLDKKETQRIIYQIDNLRNTLLKVMDKGGVTVVVEDETLITTYNLYKKNRNK
ncbi:MULTISPECIES: DUF4258 domain-containing protein [Arcobacteraceae]|uniref:DUF4258 domain-containing protein n=2 Tax=Arcobacteraceae TaxID=2808963 RepID=A0AAP4UZH1_9BACT|nr:MULTISPECIES: DUF4258 domain-containing protein [Arcobacteraceae]MDN5053086.1 DUF4258 domain-containing protein [Aliarcobacter butzleri]MDN5076180.1 DUF4258 domain-containing protein [Aliarcobacter butzleri]MDN5117501.1 DUF4258 domain-containing protein [Aliarcobacter butzleri]MDN5133309.1 DUF4258 domain-containing protein [Aliarcobacter butzleri]NUW27257.1 DUF4258 domain-containing protein [Aliarcobacter butzleri]